MIQSLWPISIMIVEDWFIFFVWPTDKLIVNKYIIIVNVTKIYRYRHINIYRMVDFLFLFCMHFPSGFHVWPGFKQLHILSNRNSRFVNLRYGVKVKFLWALLYCVSWKLVVHNLHVIPDMLNQVLSKKLLQM